MRSLSLAVIGCAFFQADGQEYGRLREGTVLTHESDKLGMKQVTRVLKEEGGKVYQERKTFSGTSVQPTKVETFATYLENGYVMTANLEGDNLTDRWRVFKIGSKKGDSWKSPARTGIPELDIKHLGTEEVTVAAGTYKDSVHCGFDWEVTGAGTTKMKATVDYWMATGVGVVKMRTRMGDFEMVVELTKADIPK